MRADLLVLRPDLVLEHAVLALRLIELLRGRGLLIEEALGAIVGAACDLVLRGQRITLRLRGVSLRGDDIVLRGEAFDLLPHFLDPRRRRGALCRELLALERQLSGVDGADDRAGRQRLTLGDVVLHEAAAGFGADHHVGGLDIAVGVGLGAACAIGGRDREQAGDSDGCDRSAVSSHQRTSNPSVVSTRAWACASSTRWRACVNCAASHSVVRSSDSDAVTAPS